MSAKMAAIFSGVGVGGGEGVYKILARGGLFSRYFGELCWQQ